MHYVLLDSRLYLTTWKAHSNRRKTQGNAEEPEDESRSGEVERVQKVYESTQTRQGRRLLHRPQIQ
jgi:hypothetical protein